MKRISIHTTGKCNKAVIKFKKELPKFRNYDEWQKLYKKDAVEIYEILYASIPSGTYEALLELMHKNKPDD